MKQEEKNVLEIIDWEGSMNWNAYLIEQIETKASQVGTDIVSIDKFKNEEEFEQIVSYMMNLLIEDYKRHTGFQNVTFRFNFDDIICDVPLLANHAIGILQSSPICAMINGRFVPETNIPQIIRDVVFSYHSYKRCCAINARNNELEGIIYGNFVLTETLKAIEKSFEQAKTYFTAYGEKPKEMFKGIDKYVAHSLDATGFPNANHLNFNEFKVKVNSELNSLLEKYAKETDSSILEIEFIDDDLEQLNMGHVMIGFLTCDYEDDKVKSVNRVIVCYPLYNHVCHLHGTLGGNIALRHTIKAMEKSLNEATDYYHRHNITHVSIAKIITNAESVVYRLHALRNRMTNPNDIISMDELKQSINNMHTYITSSRFKLKDGRYIPDYNDTDLDGRVYQRYIEHVHHVAEALQHIKNIMREELQHEVMDELFNFDK